MKQEGKSRMHFIIEDPYVFIKHDYCKTSKNSKLKTETPSRTNNSQEQTKTKKIFKNGGSLVKRPKNLK